MSEDNRSEDWVPFHVFMEVAPRVSIPGKAAAVLRLRYDKSANELILRGISQNGERYVHGSEIPFFPREGMDLFRMIGGAAGVDEQHPFYQIPINDSQTYLDQLDEWVSDFCQGASMRIPNFKMKVKGERDVTREYPSSIEIADLVNRAFPREFKYTGVPPY